MTEKEEKELEEKTQYVSNLITETDLIEQVWDHGQVRFATHNFSTGKNEIHDYINYIDNGEKIIYRPIVNEHLKKGSVIIPEVNHELRDENTTFEALWRLQDQLLDEAFDAIESRNYARLLMRICTSSWFIDREETGLAGVGKFAPIIPIRGLSGGGKNRFLNILRFCGYHSFYQLSTEKIPSIFRPLELWKGVLALDEADFDVLKAKDLVGFLLARSYGNPISRQNPNVISESNAFNQFQITILTQRENFGENALEGRSIPFYSEKTWKKIPTLETPEMIELGKKIQSLSLALRLKYWDKVEIDKAFWLETSDARLNSALLPLVALGKFDSSIMPLMNKLLKDIERRKTILKSQSDDGILVNYLHNNVESNLYRPYSDGTTFYFTHEQKNIIRTAEGSVASEETIQIPLTTQMISYDLGWRSGKQVRKKLDGMMHLDGLPEQARIGEGGKNVKPVFFRADSLLKLFREFVPDFDPNKSIPEDLRPSQTKIVTDETDVTRNSIGGCHTTLSHHTPLRVTSDTSDTRPLGQKSGNCENGYHDQCGGVKCYCDCHIRSATN